MHLQELAVTDAWQRLGMCPPPPPLRSLMHPACIGDWHTPECVGRTIRGYTPSQLADDMEDRDDVEDYYLYDFSNEAGHDIKIINTKTGLAAHCAEHPGIFRNKREAWAQLQEQIAHHYGPVQ